VAFIGLNPSSADETKNDPTVRKCIGFAQRWGYGGLLMLNLYALMATKPARMWERHQKGYSISGGFKNDPVFLKAYIDKFEVKQIIAAWGCDKLDRWRTLKAAEWRLDCLKINDDGQPGHPLYLPYMAERRPWNY